MARIGDGRSGTPVRNSLIEATSSGSGPVASYKMTPEELEDYRVRTGYTQPKTPNGAPVKPPVGVTDTYKPEEQSRRAKASWANRKAEGKAMAEPSKTEFLERVANGQSISSIERAWGMKLNALHYWVTQRWDLKGISPGKARELLAGLREVAVAQEDVKPPVSVEVPNITESVIESWSEIEKIDSTKEDDVDRVNQPTHYTSGGIETIDYLKAKLTIEQYTGFMLGNVLKYCSRSRHKGGIEDLEKAKWYLDRLVSEGEHESR